MLPHSNQRLERMRPLIFWAKFEIGDVKLTRKKLMLFPKKWLKQMLKALLIRHLILKVLVSICSSVSAGLRLSGCALGPVQASVVELQSYHSEQTLKFF